MKKVWKLKNGFKVHEFLLLVDADYLFSKNADEDFYRLLNIAEFGKITEGNVEELIKTQKVLIINNDTLEMESHNIEESVMLSAFMEMS